MTRIAADFVDRFGEKSSVNRALNLY